MESATCPHCGAPLGTDASRARVVDLDGPGGHDLPIVPDISAATAGAATPRANSAGPSSRRRGTWLAVGAAALLAVVGLAFVVGGDETDPNDRDPSDGAAAVDEQADDQVTELSGGSSVSDADGTAADEAVTPVAPADDIATFFASWLDDGRSWTVAYPTPMGLQLLSADGNTQPEIEVAAGFEEAARLPIISDGGRSWAVDPARTDLAYLVSTQFYVMDLDREGRVGFINDSLDPPNIGESSFGAWGPGFDLPVGAAVLPVPGRGLFVLPPTGGTYEYVLNGVEPFNDDMLVAASIDSEVLQRCNGSLECELYVQGPALGDVLVTLEAGVNADLWLSPGGRWLVTDEPAGAALHDLVTGERRVIDGPVRAVDWSDDGSTAALLTDDELLVYRADLDDWRGVTLPIAASAPAVLLVSS